MKTHKILLILFAAFSGWCGTMNAQDADLKKRMKDADPKVIGTRIVNKFLVTPHTRFGNPRAEKAPNYVTYPDACTWLGALWFDDMFMIPTIQSQAYLATGDRKYIDRAAAEMAMYLEKIQRPNGLFYHAPTAPFFWARGNGWMAAGMSRLLSVLPKDNPNRPVIMEAYKKMMATLLENQDPDGMWHQLIDEPASYKETSGTAMFTYAMLVGVKHGWLDKKTYAPAATKGWLALVSYINDEDEVTNVCEGTNIKNDKNHYMNRKQITGDLHAHAPLLWCATELLTK